MSNPLEINSQETGSLVAAVKSHQQEADKGNVSSKAFINALFNLETISALDSNNIGAMYHEKGTVISGKEAMRWYEKAKIKDNQFGMVYRNIGVLHQTGLGVEKSFFTAAQLFQQSIEKGCDIAKQALVDLINLSDITADDLNIIGVMLYQHNNYDIAILCYEKAQAKGNLFAYKNLGILYEVKKQYLMAAKAYLKAIEHRQNVQEDLDRLFLQNAEISPNDLNSIGALFHEKHTDTLGKEAKRWYEKAKEKGEAVAFRNIGVLYLDGEGVEKNLVKAAEYYQDAIDREYRQAKNELHNLIQDPDISTRDLNNIGVILHGRKNYDAAKIFYEKAAESGSNIAFKNLGLIYEQYTAIKNIVMAAKYFQKAIDNGYQTAETDLDRLYNNDYISDAELHNIGLMYYSGDSVVQNYANAFKWQKKAQERGHALACRNIGMYYENGYVVPKNLITAAEYFLASIVKGYLNAQTDLDRLLTNPDISANELTKIGLMLYQGGDYKNAKKFYERCMAEESAIACSQLATLYHYGLGVAPDYYMAARLYQIALTRGDNNASVDLDRLFSCPNISSDDIVKVAKMYFSGDRDGIEKNLIKARKWCAHPNGNNAEAKAILSKCDVITKNGLKRSERHQVVKKHEANTLNLNGRHVNNDTYLHRAAKEKRLKDCARFLLFGTNPTIINAEGHPYSQYLSPVEQAKVQRLFERQNMLLNQLNADTPKMLAGRIFTFYGDPNQIKIESALRELYAIDAFKPLMDLAKLAVLAIHNLSNLNKFKDDNGYDSDNDDEEKINDGEERLSIHIDTKNKTVDEICMCKDKGNKGVYFPPNNKIYVGGLQAASETRAVLIHELVHFVTQEVFGKINPYRTSAQKIVFEKIEKDLEMQIRYLDPVLQGAFSVWYRDHKQVHSELIPRIAQMLVDKNKYNYLMTHEFLLYAPSQQLPNHQSREAKEQTVTSKEANVATQRLFQYYVNVFLPLVVEHINSLKKRILSGWPMQLFRREGSVGDYSFHRDEEGQNDNSKTINLRV